MEPDIAVTMTHKMEDDGFPIDAIHADNDSTTIMKLKMDFKDLKKKDDQNHTIKRITKSLIELSKSNINQIHRMDQANPCNQIWQFP